MDSNLGISYNGRMSVEILTANGMSNAPSIVIAASEQGVELAIAAAFAEQESNGHMVYGHDYAGTYSTNPNAYDVPADIGGLTKHPLGSNIPVTSANYWGTDTIRGFYNRVIIDGGKSNGVGIFQLTYRGFLVEARNLGFDLSIPLHNCRYGLKLIGGYLRGLTTDDQIKRAACHYNTGSEAGYETQWYAIQVLDRVRKWRKLLAPAPIPEPKPVPVPVGPQVTGYRWTTSDLNLRNGAAATYPILITIPKGTKIGISGKITGGWYQATYGDKWGWCSGAYLSATAPVTTTRKRRR